MPRKTKSKPAKLQENPEQIIQKIIESGHLSYKSIAKVNFVRGLAFGLGSVIGATILVGLLAWLLSLFDNMFIIGDLIDAVQASLNAG